MIKQRKITEWIGKKQVFIPYIFKEQNSLICSRKSNKIIRMEYYKEKEEYTQLSSISGLYNQEAKYISINGNVDRIGNIVIDNILYKGIEMVDMYTRILVIYKNVLIIEPEMYRYELMNKHIKVKGMKIEHPYENENIYIMAHSIKVIGPVINDRLCNDYGNLNGYRIFTVETFHQDCLINHKGIQYTITINTKDIVETRSRLVMINNKPYLENYMTIGIMTDIKVKKQDSFETFHMVSSLYNFWDIWDNIIEYIAIDQLEQEEYVLIDIFIQNHINKDNILLESYTESYKTDAIRMEVIMKYMQNVQIMLNIMKRVLEQIDKMINNYIIREQEEIILLSKCFIPNEYHEINYAKSIDNYNLSIKNIQGLWQNNIYYVDYYRKVWPLFAKSDPITGCVLGHINNSKILELFKWINYMLELDNILSYYLWDDIDINTFTELRGLVHDLINDTVLSINKHSIDTYLFI